MKAAQILDLLATTVLLLDGEGVVLLANAASEDLFGRSKRQIEGQRAVALFDVDLALEQTIHDACSGAIAGVRQVAKMHCNGVPCEISVTTMSLTQKPWMASMEITSLEQRFIVDRTQRLADEVAAQRDLLRNLAHEVKNPLGGLRGAAQLLEAELPDERLTEYTQVIISEADRLQSLVDRLIAPANTMPQKETINIHEVCERVRSLVAAEFPMIQLSRDYDASVPEVMADPSRLVQALLNVVRNAAQILTQSSSSSQPEILLRTRIAHRILVHKRQHRLAVQVSVIDNGPGVSDMVRERIFHPLVTDRQGGTGLGLSLAQDLLQQHKGMIEFKSRPGRTEFKLTLPLELP